MLEGSAAFIADLVDIDRSILPFDLGHGLVCDVATEPERATTKGWLRRELAPFVGATETETAATEMYEFGPIGSGSEFVVLPEAEHRYFVFRAAESMAIRFDTLERVGRLCDPELVPALTMFDIGELGVATNVPSRVRFHTHYTGTGHYGRAPSMEPPTVDSVGVAELKRLRELVGWHAALADEPSRITRALSLFEQCDDIVRFAGMWPLAHFAVIEALLTHQSRGSDDSIARQLQLSIPLLLRRSYELELEEPFGLHASVGTVVKKLYDFRSKLAHGAWERNEPFPSQWAVLEDYKMACIVLRKMTKTLLIQALNEPQLVLDLAGPD